MRNSLFVLFLLVLSLGMAGCTGGDSGEQAAADETNQEENGPDKTVFAFLEAVREGDHVVAGEMLTDMALKMTKERDLVIAPDGSATAKFTVGEVEIVNEKEALVASDWTDVVDGHEQTDRTVWVLKLQDKGWRIAGMVMPLFEDQLVLNFEDPDDMERKQKLAEQEIIRRANVDAQKAILGTQPQDATPQLGAPVQEAQRINNVNQPRMR